MRLTLVLPLLGVAAVAAAAPVRPAGKAAPPAPKPAARTVEFNRDVLPILSDNCFACHGPDAASRKAGLRLDTREGALAKLAIGQAGIVPGKPAASSVMQRVTMPAPMVMPPPVTGKTLSAKQKETLRLWIAQGAKYDKHWAFLPPKRPALPKVKQADWPRNGLDIFILNRLEREALKPSPEADRSTLLRRVTLDLTGLPPTAAERDAFLKDTAPDAYEKVVDRLLASPHYGERMALKWLDIARYADTHGYHIDSQRDMWRWRDWVIDAYNQNLPYDKFVTWQLAGDMLPNATLEQKIATGFNRNHPINYEGGAIPEEYQTQYVMDRVETTATAFMGLTLKCAQCHDHKYDPLSQKEYYSFYAFFNNIPENGLDGQAGNAAPFIKAPLPGQQEQLDALTAKATEAEQAVKAREASQAEAAAAWAAKAQDELQKSPPVAAGLAAHYLLDETSGESAADALGKAPAGTFKGKVTRGAGKVGGALTFDGASHVEAGDVAGFERDQKFSYGAWVNPASRDAMTVLSRMDDEAKFRGWDLYLGDGRVFVHIVSEWEGNALRLNTKAQIEANQWTHVFATYDGSGKAKGVKLYINGKPQEVDVTHDTLNGSIKTAKPLVIGRRNPGAPFRGMIDEVRVYERELAAEEVARLVGADTLRGLFAVPEEKRTAEQKATVTRYYLENEDETYKKLAADLAARRKARDDFDKSIPTTMVMQEMEKPRETKVLIRGEYDKFGEKVSPTVPAILPPLPKVDKADRLALAKWLADPKHPLTSRVAVNRLWQTFFGTGLVKTAEDFGTQGERPSHPELLDWLATEFVNFGWDTKAMVKLIVTSATYRQSSRATKELLEKDPENRLLARAPRYRLPAEFVRDHALAVSGLLVEKIGGPSVKPYQPAGLWEEMAFGGGFSAQKYEQDHGEALYRRGMYTFWKRTVPPPSLMTFDAPEREFCIPRRSVTNTPLQALVLMNDPTYVEASRHFAERILTQGPASPWARVKWAFQRAVGRAPKAVEEKVLLGLYNEQLQAFQKDREGALKLLSVGESKRDERLDPAEHAAWTTVASTLLNLDEAITRS